MRLNIVSIEAATPGVGPGCGPPGSTKAAVASVGIGTVTSSTPGRFEPLGAVKLDRVPTLGETVGEVTDHGLGPAGLSAPTGVTGEATMAIRIRSS